MIIKRDIFKKKPLPFRMHFEESNVLYEFSNKLLDFLPSIRGKDIIIVCIGTDRSTGDSLGPLIGTKLAEKQVSSFHIYGTLEDPIHALNLEEKMNEIYRKHRNPFIIGIDACLGRSSSVGIISIADGPVKPGAAVNKKLPPVGDIHITGIVNVGGYMEYMVLQNTRLHFVMKMAETISSSLLLADSKMRRQNDQQFFNPLRSSFFSS